MPGRKIFSAERELISRMGERELNSTPTLENINKNIIDLKYDIKSLVNTLASGNSAEPIQNVKTNDEIEQLIVDRNEFEKHTKELETLRIELKEISDTIEKTKNDIAELAPIAKSEGDGLIAVTSELDSITDATEKAAEEILEMTENIETVAESIKAENNNSHLYQQAEEILQFTTSIFEACNFQDLTGQRISKAIKTLNFVSERINRIIDVWGSKNLIEAKEKPVLGIKEDCGVTISGPASEGEGISQNDIDALFD